MASELRDDAYYMEEINRLRRERKAVILAHNYQRGEVQDIADFVGDSLGLSQEAARTDAVVIVFCGVHFMAETAAILSPEKKVLLPDERAGCPMADMITSEALREEKRKYPEAAVVCYVNTSAAVKAECDLCCTSSNAVEVVRSLEGHEQILFVPDEHLGRFVASQVKKEFIFWKGYCATHYNVVAEEIREMRKEYPRAKVLVHPECRMEVIQLADAALSTGGIIKYVHNSKETEFVIGTEMGIIHRLQKENPDKKFYLASDKLICPNMKLITLRKVYTALKNMEPEIIVPEDIRRRAEQALSRMLEVKLD